MKFRKGFSLLEMIVVIAIIAIIMGILGFAVPAMLHSVEVRTWEADMITVKKALLTYYTSEHYGHFPDPPSHMEPFDQWAQDTGLSQFLDKNLVNPFNKNETITIDEVSVTKPVDAFLDSYLIPTAFGLMIPTPTIGYEVSNGTDIDGTPIINGHFILYWTIGEQEYELSDGKGITKVNHE